jgi:creatinine amidohydrolase
MSPAGNHRSEPETPPPSFFDPLLRGPSFALLLKSSTDQSILPETEKERGFPMAILKTVPHMFANLSWKDVEQIKKDRRFVLLLPVGSTESHGPHAPLSTDISISLEVCLRSAEKLQDLNYRAYVLPPLSYAVTECARKFPGTISISPEVDEGLISDICFSLVAGGVSKIGIFNSHFEPSHVKCIYNAIQHVEEKTGAKILFTDITRKRYSSRLTDVFQMGQSHADKYETSIMMAIDPSLVNEERRKSLPYLPINLVEKLFSEGLDEFQDFGMPEAYCGNPAAASVEEGEKILKLLSDFVVEDVKRLMKDKPADIQRGLYGRER